MPWDRWFRLAFLCVVVVEVVCTFASPGPKKLELHELVTKLTVPAECLPPIETKRAKMLQKVHPS